MADPSKLLNGAVSDGGGGNRCRQLYPSFQRIIRRKTCSTPRKYDNQTRNDWKIEIYASSHGHFRVEVEINGENEEFLVDTGASMVSFSLETAERLGFDEASLDFSARSRTANGMVAIAMVTLDEVSIGELTLRNVKAAIRRTKTGPSLLGMSFLRRLEGYEVREGKLVLHW